MVQHSSVVLLLVLKYSVLKYSVVQHSVVLVLKHSVVLKLKYSAVQFRPPPKVSRSVSPRQRPLLQLQHPS